MKKLILFLIILSLLINWMPTTAEAAAPTITMTPPSGTQYKSFTVPITFDQAVSGFGIGDDITLSPAGYGIKNTKCPLPAS